MALVRFELALLFFMGLGLVQVSHSQNSPEDFLKAHNTARAQVNVGPMSWNNTIAAFAQAFANQVAVDCDLEHSVRPHGGPYGENLAKGSGDFTGTDAVTLWVSEKKNYDYKSNSCVGGECRNYTQVVRRDSVRLGCARVKCPNSDFFFVTCKYDPRDLREDDTGGFMLGSASYFAAPPFAAPPFGGFDYPGTSTGSNGSKALIGIVSSVIAAVVLGVLILIGIYRYKLCFNRKKESDQHVELFFESYESQAPRRYKYSDLKKMTNSFKEKLGQGGFGSVFKGKLFDGCPVAVKVLNESKGTGEEFINEVATISRTNHLNIVSLFGFCFEGSKRALIYEFMPNGSLEKFIYDRKASAAHPLGWEKLHEIAVGIARGLEYLHRGCNTRILHFDIKPHNILLDENFCPKISDFGMAKLYSTRESIVSVVGRRGTTGYMAPEVFCINFGGVSYKSDVYSYGMMLLEMVGGRKNIDPGIENISEISFPHWIYKKLEEQGHTRLEGFAKIIEEEVARKMILVAIWCIQTDPINRPSMSKVVEMLEGNSGSLVMPPNPFCNQISASMPSPP